jgi:hypothetical protein
MWRRSDESCGGDRSRFILQLVSPRQRFIVSSTEQAALRRPNATMPNPTKGELQETYISAEDDPFAPPLSLLILQTGQAERSVQPDGTGIGDSGRGRRYRPREVRSEAQCAIL